MKDKRIYTLSEEAPAKAVIKLGVPLIMGMMIMVLYNLVDPYFIGLMHDDYQLAAVNLGYPIMMVSIAISNMVGTGAASLIARSFGAGDTNKANHTLTVGFTLTVVNGLIVTLVGILFLSPIVRGLGARQIHLITHASMYLCFYLEVFLPWEIIPLVSFLEQRGQLNIPSSEWYLEQ